MSPNELLGHAGRLPLLTAMDELRLAKRIERGDLAAKDELIERNLRLVVSLARPFAGAGVPLEDLVQEGALGLMRAAEKFDHRRGLRFSTYAAWWIRRAFVNAVAAERAIRIPASARQQMAAIERARLELRDAAPTADAVAGRTGLSERTVRALSDVARVTASLDEPVGDEGLPLGELIAEPDAEDPWVLASERERERRVQEMVRVLPRRQREVVQRRYGLAGEAAETHEEIGASLGVGDERSRQLERQALHWLRQLGGRNQLAA